MTSRRGIWIAMAAVAAFLLLGRAASGVYANYRWYAALGASDVWALQFGSAVRLRVLAFVAGGAIAFVNLWGVRHSVVSLVRPRQLGNIEIGEEVPGRVLMSIVIGLSVVAGALLAIPASDWRGFVLAQHGIPFGELDPFFNRDLGFFVYWLPFERAVYAWMLTVVAIVTALVVGLYALTPSLKWEQGRIHVSTYVRRHIAVLAGAVLAIVAWSFRLDGYGALTAGADATGGFSALDHLPGIPISSVLSYVAIGGAFVVAWAGWTGQTRIAVVMMSVVLLATPTMRYLLPLAVRWGSAPVDPAVRDRPYAAVRAAFTRRAFGVDAIRVLPRTESLRSVQDAAGTTVWDPAALTRAAERTRRRGAIIGPPTLVGTAAGPTLVSVEQPALPGESVGGAWTVVRSMAAVTDQRGALIRVDVEGRYPLEDQPLGDVLIHVGARGHVVVRDTTGRIAAPPMESFTARLTEAWNVQNYRLLALPVRGARMVRRRDVRERVDALLPFFAQGARVFPIVHGDSLLWTVELYSATRSFPLSRRFGLVDGEVSYFRHMGLALVNASTGRVTVLPDDELDPIARTWVRRLPETLGRLHSLPPSLIAMLPPDVDGAEFQAEAFAAVGTRAEGGVRRHRPPLDGSDTLITTHAPTLLWLPSMGAAAWTTPLVDDRDRIAGILVATGGARRELRWFAVSDTAARWGAALEQLARAADSAMERGSEPRARGRVRLLPLGDGRVIALQPFYGWPSAGPPYVSRVAMVIGDSARSAPSMAAVVGAPVPRDPISTSPAALQERMRALYAEMRAALQRGDWRAFGAAMDALGALLERR